MIYDPRADLRYLLKGHDFLERSLKMTLRLTVALRSYFQIFTDDEKIKFVEYSTQKARFI
jgi:hypothetical protein